MKLSKKIWKIAVSIAERFHLEDSLSMIVRGKPLCAYKWSQEELERVCMRNFTRDMGYSFDIRRPKTFNEKIQWYALFYNYEEISQASNKVSFKDFVSSKIGEGHVVPMYGHWDSVDGVRAEWDQFPDSFVLKGNMLFDDRGTMIIKDKSKVDVNKVIHIVKNWLNPRNTELNNVFCNMYKGVKPELLVEEYVSDGNSRLTDYKFYCFDGDPYCLYVDFNGAISFFDIKWQKLDVHYPNFPSIDVPLQKPPHFEDMIEAAKILSKGFPFVRVDFYDTEDKYYVGEMTFNSGYGHRIFEPYSFDLTLGKKFVLPDNS